MRRWPAAGVVALLALSLALAAGFAAAAPEEPAFVVHRVDEGHFTPGLDQPVFVVVIGTDERPGLVGARADALHLIGVNRAQGKATILNIPRDAFVPIPGRGRNRINEAFAAGGPALQAQTVGELVGVPVSLAVTTTFEGLTNMVNELGGVEVDVPIAMDDVFSGAQFAPGRVHMDGRAALAFARNRHIPDGDLRRTEHQGILIIAGLAKLRADASAAATLRYLAVLLRNSRTEGLAIRDLYRLGRLGLALDPANVRAVNLPVTVGSSGGSSVVFPTDAAGALFADLRDNAVLDAH